MGRMFTQTIVYTQDGHGKKADAYINIMIDKQKRHGNQWVLKWQQFLHKNQYMPDFY